MTSTPVLLLILPVHWLFFLPPAVSKCPDVNQHVNCSFETNQECLSDYQRYDKHGLKWNIRNGALTEYQTRRQQNNGQYSRRRTTYLQGSPKDQFVYIPGSTDSRVLGKWTDLVSPPFTADHQGCLYFLFHNNVCGQKYEPLNINFKVLLRPEEGSKADKLLREYPCINSTAWYKARIPIQSISGVYRIVFSAKQHPISNQTIGVDDVIYSDQSCSIQDDMRYRSGDCDFEDADWCRYTQVPTRATKLKWLPIQKEMKSFRESRDQAPAGYFLALWGNEQATDPELAAVHIDSPEISLTSPGCLSLTYYSGRYHLDNNNVTALVVSRVQTQNKTKSVLRELPATLGEEWIKDFIPIPKGMYKLRFTAVVKLPFGESQNDVIGIDDIEVHEKSCDQIKCDGVLCEAKNVQICNRRGTCQGRGLKHKSCECNSGYIGRQCEFTTQGQNTRNRNPYG